MRRLLFREHELAVFGAVLLSLFVVVTSAPLLSLIPLETRVGHAGGGCVDLSAVSGPVTGPIDLCPGTHTLTAPLTVLPNTVLDCHGAAITGPATITGIILNGTPYILYGITYHTAAANITIRNCSLSGFGIGISNQACAPGSYFDEAPSFCWWVGMSEVMFEGVAVSATSTAMALRGAADVRLVTSTISGNTMGLLSANVLSLTINASNLQDNLIDFACSSLSPGQSKVRGQQDIIDSRLIEKCDLSGLSYAHSDGSTLAQTCGNGFLEDRGATQYPEFCEFQGSVMIKNPLYPSRTSCGMTGSGIALLGEVACTPPSLGNLNGCQINYADCHLPPDTPFCHDGLDNEGWGAVNYPNGCNDTADWACGGVETSCADGKDNDCDSPVDAADRDCAAPPPSPCVPAPEACTDGVDEDCDSLIDCADPDCAGAAGCATTGNATAPNATCGDGTCDPSEICASCPADCPCVSLASCGDNLCDLEEDCSNCPHDCGTCPATGGTTGGSPLILKGDSSPTLFKTVTCVLHPENCTNGKDDDCDLKVDLRDIDCWPNRTNTTQRNQTNISANASRNWTKEPSGTFITITLPFPSGTLIMAAGAGAAAEAIVPSPDAPAGTFYAFTVQVMNGTANVTITSSQAFDAYLRSVQWTRIPVEDLGAGTYSLTSLVAGEYVLVARPGKEPATVPDDGTPEIEMPQPTSSTFPWIYIIIFGVLLVALLLFIFRKKIFGKHPEEQSLQPEYVSAKGKVRPMVGNARQKDLSSPLLRAPPQEKSPLVKKFEAKEILKSHLARGHNISDVKLNMIKAGWDPKTVEAAEEEIKKEKSR